MPSKNNVRPLALSLTVLGILGRLVPHPPNFTPVGAASLYAGARLGAWQAYLVPLLTMALSDPLINLARGGPLYRRGAWVIYGCFLINVWIGRRLRASQNAQRIGAAAVLGSVQFFLITNFAVWLRGSAFPHDLSGLLACYTFALPFFGATLAGDLVFAAVLFGLHAWLSRRVFIREAIA